MPPDVLDHILEVTNARPCGRDRWMGHGLCHGSKRNRDLSIRKTSDRILLHDFTGCELSVICAALGVRVADLFDDTPISRGSRRAPKPVRRDRTALAFQFDLAALDLRLRSSRVVEAGKNLTVAALDDVERDHTLGHVAQAYIDEARAELFEHVADTLRTRDCIERKANEQRTSVA